MRLNPDVYPTIYKAALLLITDQGFPTPDFINIDVVEETYNLYEIEQTLKSLTEQELDDFCCGDFDEDQMPIVNRDETFLKAHQFLEMLFESIGESIGECDG